VGIARAAVAALDDVRGVGNHSCMQRTPLSGRPIAWASLLLATSLLGCAPSPERVCKKMIDLQGGWFSSDQERADGFKYCVQVKTEQKRTNPTKYKCEADCVIDERNLVAASECNAKCK
jgi:hypothetical protein